MVFLYCIIFNYISSKVAPWSVIPNSRIINSKAGVGLILILPLNSFRLIDSGLLSTSTLNSVKPR
jgi:hypothetical protein